MRHRKKIQEFYAPDSKTSVDELITNFNISPKEGKLINNIINIIVDNTKIGYSGTDVWLYISDLFDWSNDGILINALKEEDKTKSFIKWSDNVTPYILKAIIKYLERYYSTNQSSYALVITYGVMEGIYQKFFNNSRGIVVESKDNKLYDYIDKVAQIIMDDTILKIMQSRESEVLTEYPFHRSKDPDNLLYVDIHDIRELKKNGEVDFGITHSVSFVSQCRDVYGLTKEESFICLEIYKNMLHKKIINLWDNYKKR